jgi:autotransporter-associated beta strand protein
MTDKTWIGFTTIYTVGSNWNPSIIPPGPGDTAIFGSGGMSKTVDIFGVISTTADEWHFNGGAYTVNVNTGVDLQGAGVQVDPGGAALIKIGISNSFVFENASSAGSATYEMLPSSSASVQFEGHSDGGTARFITDSSTSFVDFSGSVGPNGDNKIEAGSIEGAGDFSIGLNQLLTVGSNNLPAVVSGKILGGSGSSLTKVGTGALTLSGANTYAGATTINGGTLLVDGSIANSISDVKSGATLGGSGATAAVTIESGGTLAPGDGPGILHTGSVSFAAGAHFAVELGGINPGTGGYDQLAANGTVNLGGSTLDLSLVNGFHPVLGEKFEIVTSSNPITGTFAGLVEGARFLDGGVTYTISYQGDDVLLTVVKLGVTIVISKPGHHLIDATHTVAGQPFPTDFGDLIICRKGNDIVHGGAGNNTIIGGPGHDKLYAGTGNDLLIAGRGHNLLVGGSGHDTFLFRSFHTDAHIAHFHPDADKLEFAKSVFKSLDHIHYDAATGALLTDVASGGSGQPIQFATLAPHLHIPHGDLLLV